MQCRHCGAQLNKKEHLKDGILVCPECGAKYRIKTAEQPVVRPVKKGFAVKPDKLWLYIGAAALVVLLVIVFFSIPKSAQDEEILTAQTVETPEPSASATPAPTPEPTPEPIEAASVHFRAVGDIMCHKLQLTNAKQKDGSYNFFPQFMAVKDALSKADYTIGNLEFSVAVDKNYSSYPRFRTPVTMLDAIKDSGIDFLTMANNHILDGFYNGLVKTLDEVDARGFDHVGAYRTQEEHDTPVIKEINGIKFGFVAYTYGTNGNEKHTSEKTRKFQVDYLDDADIEGDVKRLREAGAEVVIALPHMGEEYKRYVRTGIKNKAKRLINAGVDIILASHPHVVLPVEMVTGTTSSGEKKTVLIAWSLGNFLSNCATQYTDSGIILDFTVERDTEGKITIRDVGYVPVYVWGTKDRFHVLCSGDFYNKRPNGMRNTHYDRLRASVKEITDMIGTKKGISVLKN